MQLLPILSSASRRQHHNCLDIHLPSSTFHARHWQIHDDTTPLSSCCVHCTLTCETWRRFRQGRQAARLFRANKVLLSDSRCSRPRAHSIFISFWSLLRAIPRPFHAMILSGRRVGLQAMQSHTSSPTACPERTRSSPSRAHPLANNWPASHR